MPTVFVIITFSDIFKDIGSAAKNKLSKITFLIFCPQKTVGDSRSNNVFEFSMENT